MNMPVREISLASNVEGLLRRWGFFPHAPAQLLSHAENVVNWRGKQVGSIVAALNICTQGKIEELLAGKPNNGKTLQHLRESGIDSLQNRIDEILAIQDGVAYIGRPFTELTIHSEFVKKEVGTSLRDEYNNWDCLPLSVDGNLVLAFSDSGKRTQFISLAGAERTSSALSQVLAKLWDVSITSSKLRTLLSDRSAIADSAVLVHYHSQLQEMNGSGESAEEGLQTIYQHEGGGSDVMAQLIRVLDQALSLNVNDVAIVPDRDTGNGRVYFRQFQRMTNSGIVLAPDMREDVTRVLLTRSRANPAASRLRRPADGNLNLDLKRGAAFMRMSFIPLEESKFPATSTSIRVLPRNVKAVSLHELNIDPELQEELNFFLRRKNGLFIVCGPTNSGKSTTIGAMLTEHFNRYGFNKKRISVEQPVERILPGVLHIDVSQHRYLDNEKVEGSNFAMALRAILRHDPDVIFVGEVRDTESCAVCVDAANTGHLVFSTTHANDEILGYLRLANFMPESRRFDLINVLQGVLAQRLVSIVCEHCSHEQALDDDSIEDLEHYARNAGVELEKYRSSLPSTHRVADPRGCQHCIEGYSGMKPIHGLMTMNPKVRKLLLSRDENDWMKAQEASDSKFTLFGSAFKLFAKGAITLEEVMI